MADFEGDQDAEMALMQFQSGEMTDLDALLGLEQSQDALGLSGSSTVVQGPPSSGALDEDMPLDESVSVPENIDVAPTTMIASFRLTGELPIDLKKVCFAIRHAEYNPRKHNCVTIRLVGSHPAIALIRPTGVCSISGQTDPVVLKNCAKQSACLVKKAGHPNLRFSEFQVKSLFCKADIHAPVRLDRLAMEWRMNATYEPEFYCGCVFKTRNPPLSFLITHGGKIIISKCTSVDQARDALRRLYPILLKHRD